MIPRILHQCWVGDPMPRDVRAWVKSVGQHHPDWSHIVWTEAMLLELDINVRTLKEKYGSWASVTNWVRLALLMRFGGVWLDTDIEALDSLDRLPLENYKAFAAEQDGGRTCNAILAAEAYSPWILWQMQHFDDLDQKDAAQGVTLATAAPREGVTIVPQHYVFPWLYDSPPEKRVPHRDSILCHHWLGSWVSKK
jgi:mannosyltransferase OCH1-like enzyme